MSMEEIKLEQTNIIERINQISKEIDNAEDFSVIRSLVGEDIQLLKRFDQLDSRLKEITMNNVFDKIRKMMGR